MSKPEEIKLWCWVLGDPPNRAFIASIKLSDPIYNLQKAIYEQKPSFKGVISIGSLEVYKFELPLDNFDEAYAQNIKLEDGQRVARPWDDISSYWKKDPGKVLSVILPRPIGTTITPSSSHNSNLLLNEPPSWPVPVVKVSLREDTVTALYERLENYAFIQVRGTPASGKTVLALLLATYISEKNPNAHVIWIDGWPAAVKQSGSYQSYLQQKGWVLDQETVFIFDEAQATYTDNALWNFFKSMHLFALCRAIIFCSYGSPSLHIDVGETPGMLTPIVVMDAQRVTLRHIDHEDYLPPVGLLLTQSEFTDLVKVHYSSPEYCFDSSFFDSVFRITNGHVGAIYDFIRIVTADGSYREFKHASKRYTWDSFLAAFTAKSFLQKLGSVSVFGRGLPSDQKLQISAIASVFSAVLRTNVVKEADFGTIPERNALQQCYLKGWLHSDKLENDVLVYLFPSSLHRWYVEWKLWGSFSKEPQFQGAQFQATSLLELVICIICRFSPQHLSTERGFGPGCIQRPPEAQYQDEIYRCCHVLSEGSLIAFPEFGTANGRVDFYIPARGWGIELTRDGNRLANHWGRFSEGGSYRETLHLTDYIIVDCRTTRPMVEHPHMSKLYHAVFEDNFHHVCILDNRLREVRSFPLLSS